MGDSWLSAYDGCDRHGYDLMEKINARNRQTRNSTSYNNESAHIRIEMMKFDKQLESLKQELVQAARQRRITHSEMDRRQVMIDKLVTKRRQMEQHLKNEDGTDQRNNLLRSEAGMDDLWGAQAARNLEEDIHNPFASVDEIRQQQKQIIQEQDEGLDALSKVLSRQGQMALDIGNEVDSQNELIDDIADHVDTTNQRLISETQHIRVVERKSNTCWMWVVIVLLFVAILVICVIPK